MATIAIILSQWDGEGAVGVMIPTETMKTYVLSLKEKKLSGPRRDSKTAGVPRYDVAAVPVARLLTKRRTEIRALLKEYYIAEGPKTVTLIGMAEENEQLREKFEAQLATLQGKVVILGDAKRQAAARALSARQDWQERCRVRLQAERTVAAEKAKVVAEAAASHRRSITSQTSAT